MSKDLLDILWSTSATDGASMPVGPAACRNDAEVDQLMEAWFLERRDSVEFAILLEQARIILARLLAGGLGTMPDRRKARNLIREINQSIGRGG